MGFELRELAPAETALAYAAMKELRPEIAGRDAFVELVNDVLREDGYRLVGVFEDGLSDAQAVAGFRTLRGIAWGRYLYVDDLSTLPRARRKGYARQLLDWLEVEAERLECAQVHLDSGVGAGRADAHRLYLNAGLQIGGHHFAKELT